MSLAPYRTLLRLPGVGRLLAFAVLARLPLTASGVVLTLHVVTALHRGYAAAGLVTTATMVAMGVGFPWRGRAVDRLGLRTALLPSVVVATACWVLTPFVGFGALVALSAVGGLFGLPVFTIVRQSLSVLVPPDQRRTAFSLDGIGTELSFMVGPAVGVLLATRFSTRTALLAVAGATLVVGVALLVANPPTRSTEPPEEAPEEPDEGGAERLPRSQWFSPRLVAVLVVAAGATVVLSGTDVGLVAHLREHGAVALSGLVFAAWSAGSMVGGLVYGALHREVSPFAMLLGLALLTVPVGLAPGPWTLLLTILPAAALCAPVIASTAEGVSRLVPEAARGEAMGWQGSALQAGSALGAPLAGVAMDAYGAWSGFVVVGVVGLLIAGCGPLLLRGRRPDAVEGPAPARPEAAREPDSLASRPA